MLWIVTLVGYGTINVTRQDIYTCLSLSLGCTLSEDWGRRQFCLKLEVKHWAQCMGPNRTWVSYAEEWMSECPAEHLSHLQERIASVGCQGTQNSAQPAFWVRHGYLRLLVKSLTEQEPQTQALTLQPTCVGWQPRRPSSRAQGHRTSRLFIMVAQLCVRRVSLLEPKGFPINHNRSSMSCPLTMLYHLPNRFCFLFLNLPTVFCKF